MDAGRRKSRKSARDAGQPNQLLRALPTADYALILPHLQRVTLGVGDIISDANTRTRHVLFPETAVLSLIIVMADGAAVEAATVGNEGIVGLAAFLGDGAMTTQCLPSQRALACGESPHQGPSRRCNAGTIESGVVTGPESCCRLSLRCRAKRSIRVASSRGGRNPS